MSYSSKAVCSGVFNRRSSAAVPPAPVGGCSGISDYEVHGFSERLLTETTRGAAVCVTCLDTHEEDDPALMDVKL